MSTTTSTDIELLIEIGTRLRGYRLQANLTQEDLGTRSGVARTTIRDIESGRDAQLSTLVRLLRGLGRLADLDAFLPPPSISPIQLLKSRGKPRQRVRHGKAGRSPAG
jgi:transcriptional regulator with XRE-family HTH domain